MGQIVIELSSLDKFSFQEAVEVWNEGFVGYFTDMKRTLHKHIEYLGANSVYPEYSVVAVIDGKPAGFVLTAIRTFEGIKTAWNAGTGVTPAYRGMGVGKAMMSEAVRIYREQSIHMAYLEVIFENKRAIALYSSCGFQVQERIFWYSRKGASERPLFSKESLHKYRVNRASLHEAGKLAFYRNNVPWGSKWPNIQGGEAMLVLDESDRIAGYALLKRIYNEDGKLSEIKLLQGEVDLQREDSLDAARFLLAEVYAPYSEDFMRSAENILESNLIFNRLLKEAGLEVVLDQNLMVLDL